jgi:serine/threonine protein kinase
LGEGTFGKVKQAVQVETGERVAIKILDKEKIHQQVRASAAARAPPASASAATARAASSSAPEAAHDAHDRALEFAATAGSRWATRSKRRST